MTAMTMARLTDRTRGTVGLCDPLTSHRPSRDDPAMMARSTALRR